MTRRDVYDIFLSEKNNLQNNVQAKTPLWNLKNSCQCALLFAWIKARRVHSRLLSIDHFIVGEGDWWEEV